MKRRGRFAWRCVAVLALGSWLHAGETAASPAKAKTELLPETVMVKYHVIPGKEAEFLQVLRAERQLLRARHFVVENEHYVLVRGGDDETWFVEMFTWVDGGIPDHAPAEVKAYWKKLEGLCHLASQRSGIEIAEVEPVGEN